MRVALAHVPKVVRVAGELDSLFAMAMPMGLLSLGHTLDSAGHQVEIIHAGVELQLDRGFSLSAALAESQPTLVGLSLHWHHQLAEVLAEAEAIRSKLPAATIVVGGLTASTFDRDLLARSQAIDAVIRGEAEGPLLDFVRHLEEGREPSGVANLSWRRDGAIVQNPLAWSADAEALSAMGFARLDLLRHAEHYSGDPWVPLYGEPPPRDGRRMFYLCVGRGCDWECAFCAGCRSAQRLFTGSSGPVLRSPEAVCATIVEAHQQGVDALTICYDPAVAVQRGYYLELFSRLRETGLRPAIEFECFGLPREDFVDAFAATFDLARSKLVLSPGTANEDYRRRLHGPRHDNAELEAILGHARDRGVASHICLSIYPPEGWQDARQTARWQRKLAQKYGSSLFQCPVEMEPWAPWQRDPERYGLSQVRSTLAEYVERHQREGHHERAWEEEIGYPSRDLGARTLLLRSHCEQPEPAVQRALSGLSRSGSSRMVVADVSALERALEVVGRWEPGQITLVLDGDPDDAETEELARRICTASASVARLHTMASRPQASERVWPGATVARSSYRAGLAAATPASSGVTALRLADRKDGALFVRHVLAQGQELAPRLLQRGCLLEDGCRFAAAPCPALAGRRLVISADGQPRGCAALPLEHQAGDRWVDLLTRLRPLARAAQERRGCADCPAAARCARCLAPEPLSEDEYCTLMRSAATADLCDGLMGRR